MPPKRRERSAGRQPVAEAEDHKSVQQVDDNEDDDDEDISENTRQLFQKSVIIREDNVAEEMPELTAIRHQQKRFKRLTYLDTMKLLEEGLSIKSEQKVPKDIWDSKFLIGYKTSLTYSQDMKRPFIYVPNQATSECTFPLTKWQRIFRTIRVTCGIHKYLRRSQFLEVSDLLKGDSIERLKNRSADQSKIMFDKRRIYGLEEWREIMDNVIVSICPVDNMNRVEIRKVNYI